AFCGPSRRELPNHRHYVGASLPITFIKDRAQIAVLDPRGLPRIGEIYLAFLDEIAFIAHGNDRSGGVLVHMQDANFLSPNLDRNNFHDRGWVVVMTNNTGIFSKYF